jgi:iron(III) transport system ATP-binding protein
MSLSIGVRIQNVSKTYAKRPVLDGITLEVQPGEIVCLLGASGCGKTTMLRSLAGLERPESGRIQIGDQVVLDKDTFVPTERRHIGMVFQSYAIWPHMTVMSNVEYGLRRRGLKARDLRARAERALANVGLEEYGQRYPHELSGGQQQRVALARSLATEPAVLLLDEPLSNLDARLRETTRARLREMVRESRTTSVFVTHDQQEAMSIADRIAVMDSGRIGQVDTPRALYETPASARVSAIMGRANYIEVDVKESTPGSGEVVVSSRGKVFRVKTGAVGGDISSVAMLVIRPEALKIVPESLSQADDVFQVSATVSTSSYLGDRWEIIGTFVDGSPMIAAADRSYEPGTALNLSASIDRISVVPRDTAHSVDESESAT